MKQLRSCGVAVVLVLLTLLGVGVAQGQNRGFKNLKVLPRDISNEDLNRIMLDNLRGLGLPRLAGEGCLHCHEGSLERPRSSWDYASDAKPMKAKARVMLSMVREINGTFLRRLEHRLAPDSEVTCLTCHAGRTDPRSLGEVLRASYAAGGLDSLTRRYAALWDRYYGSNAYDFRQGVLEGLALEFADAGRRADAIEVARMEMDRYPNDPAAERAWVRLQLEQSIAELGIDRALAAFETGAQGLSAAVFTPALLDDLAWRVFRKEQKVEGRALVAANLRHFPTEYIPTESSAFMLQDAGDIDGAIQLLERWLQSHPNHDRARQLILNMRARK